MRFRSVRVSLSQGLGFGEDSVLDQAFQYGVDAFGVLGSVVLNTIATISAMGDMVAIVFSLALRGG